MNLHIIYTETDMVLSKKDYESWREIQDEYVTYKTSLGPWGMDEVIEYLTDEYPKLSPKANIQIKEFENTNSQTWVLKFSESQ
ncbi:hypothetical protein [Marinomonas posidonica]|uniref:Uncharacterized protein n=1 Tax=Marinomonas posidonica (strain CECT 7376 / NCIMB 14433 / IVIA-Po-181) TaxID=491952 RepID=F6CWK6_MARPP|nr:hypothetical protein [Marinomonas posidonica]AEF54356.1 hypothetical protein Mar181_1309 [Marinomonas posidonica IVIA-Po-181]